MNPGIAVRAAVIIVAEGDIRELAGQARTGV